MARGAVAVAVPVAVTVGMAVAVVLVVAPKLVMPVLAIVSEHAPVLAIVSDEQMARADKQSTLVTG